MKQIEIVIHNRTGLHARPAKVLVNLAKQFKSDIRLQHGEKKANAKSMVSVLTLGVVSGSEITVQVDGADEEKAIAEIEAAILAGLGDEDRHAQADVQPVPVRTDAARQSPPLAETVGPGVIKRVGAAPGIAVGPIFHFQQAEFDLDKPEIPGSNGQMELPEALRCAKEQLTQLHQQMTDKKLGAEAAIFEAHREILDDPELMEAVQLHVAAGQSTIKSWKLTIDERADAIAALNDPLLAARAADLRDVGKRVLRLMLGVKENGSSLPTTPVVIVARELSPSDTASFDPERVLGFGIVEGGPTSHIAILAL